MQKKIVIKKIEQFFHAMHFEMLFNKTCLKKKMSYLYKYMRDETFLLPEVVIPPTWRRAIFGIKKVKK